MRKLHKNVFKRIFYDIFKEGRKKVGKEKELDFAVTKTDIEKSFEACEEAFNSSKFGNKGERVKYYIRMKYYIWSYEHNAWWKPCHHGYTQHLSEAGTYFAEEAVAICEKANVCKKGVPNEVILSEDIIRRLQQKEWSKETSSTQDVPKPSKVDVAPNARKK